MLSSLVTWLWTLPSCSLFLPLLPSPVPSERQPHQARARPLCYQVTGSAEKATSRYTRATEPLWTA